MSNLILENQTFWQRKWKWLVASGLISFFMILIGYFTIVSDANITDFGQAYTERNLYVDAIQVAQSNERVTHVLGTIEPLDDFSIMEGSAIYSNNRNAIETTVRIRGTKGTAKLDIVATKKDTTWTYKKITIRIKEPKESIIIVE